MDEICVLVDSTSGISLIVEACLVFVGVDGVIEDDISQFDTEKLVKVDWKLVIILFTVWSKFSPFLKSEIYFHHS